MALQQSENARLVELHEGIADKVTTVVGEYRSAQQAAEQRSEGHVERLSRLVGETSSNLGGIINRGVEQATSGLTALRNLYSDLESAQTRLAQRTEELSLSN